ncbi:hypothetical protein [Candidatus Nitrosocosmicus franklandus]|uniref:Uncharacterized protein n=1 Tax=Candidatus Nitrosocosmicus franklandianus TaxID=1798806 RepID=A0A484I6N1_9ARCH|nr:hypothetical protein [Candidatus Nitrosocosmicus franklandus]VFJ12398.1 protein of unknown function [Candidatus Nitrosocosmicus franklandus]
MTLISSSSSRARGRYREPVGIEKRVKDYFSKLIDLGNCRRGVNNNNTIYFEMRTGLGSEHLERMNEQFGIFGNQIFLLQIEEKN